MAEQGVGSGETSEAQRQAAEALRESEERYRSLFQNNHAVMLLIDPESGAIVDANPAASAYYGWTHEELLSKKIEEINTLTAEEVHAEMQLARAKTRNFFLFRHRRADGSIRDVEVYSGPLVLMGKTLLYSIVHDVTESKKAEKALQESEAKLRAILDATPFPVALVDVKDETIKYWSRSALTLFGHTAPTRGEWYQLAYPDPDYRSEVISRWKTSLEEARLSGQWVNSGEYRVACSDGSARICELYAAFVSDNLVVTFNDITERKKMEASLEDAKRTSERYLNIAAEVILGLDVQGNITLLNDSGHRLLGYAPGELIGNNWFETCLPEETRTRTRAVFAKLMSGAFSDVTTNEDTVITRNGTERALLWHNTVLRDADNRIVGVLASAEDITERKQAEKEREALQEQLLGARKLEAVGRLAGGVAHNFNNLLTGIMGSIEIARMDTPPDSPAVQSLETAQAAAAQAAGLARKLLAFGRNAMIIPVVQHANDLVESALDLIASSLPTSVEIVRDLSPDASDVLADTAQMTGVLLELVENAREAMGDTGVVTVRTRNATITEEYVATHPYARTGDALVISVADTGPGIDPAVMEHLFEPFATTKQAGRGLGLAMVFGSMKQAGGWIDVTSDHGAGTEVSLYLPRYTPPS